MGHLSQAPLIEAIFELRWGKTVTLPDGQAVFHFSDDEIGFFFGQFKSAANEKGFSIIERANPGIQDSILHIVVHRFRRAANTWPCYQIGHGVFTANQINDGYDWTTFKRTILDGVDILKNGYIGNFEEMPVIGYELRYQDAYVYEPSETPLDFLKKRFNIALEISDDFRRHPGLSEDITGPAIAFQLETTHPVGVLIFGLNEGLINGKPGIITNTTLRSLNNNCPKDDESISLWLDKAHKLQKHAFEKFTKPAFAQTLK